MTEKKRGASQLANPLIFFGGAEGDRTPDLMNAIHALSQLSYSPNEQQELIYQKPVFLSIRKEV